MAKAEKIKLDCEDLFSKEGARLLADAINSFWRARGFVSAEAEPYPLRGLAAWGVTSALRNGLPPKRLRLVLR